MTIFSPSEFNLAPEIVVSLDEHRLLTTLAMSGTDHSPDESDSLLYELERASIVPDGAVPRDVVRMGSIVFYRTTSGDHRSVQLVFPKDADIDAGKIAIMTPVGIAHRTAHRPVDHLADANRKEGGPHRARRDPAGRRR